MEFVFASWAKRNADPIRPGCFPFGSVHYAFARALDERTVLFGEYGAFFSSETGMFAIGHSDSCHKLLRLVRSGKRKPFPSEQSAHELGSLTSMEKAGLEASYRLPRFWVALTPVVLGEVFKEPMVLYNAPRTGVITEIRTLYSGGASVGLEISIDGRPTSMLPGDAILYQRIRTGHAVSKGDLLAWSMQLGATDWVRPGFVYRDALLARDYLMEHWRSQPPYAPFLFEDITAALLSGRSSDPLIGGRMGFQMLNRPDDRLEVMAGNVLAGPGHTFSATPEDIERISKSSLPPVLSDAEGALAASRPAEPSLAAQAVVG